MHVTLRALADVSSLRAALAAASKLGFRLVQFSVPSDHLHLMVEGVDTRALGLGVRGFTIRVARAVNRALGRTGSVWNDRYHAGALATPREVRHGLVYGEPPVVPSGTWLGSVGWRRHGLVGMYERPAASEPE